MIQEVLRMALV